MYELLVNRHGYQIVVKGVSCYCVKAGFCQIQSHIGVIPREINKEFRLTFQISTKFGMLIAYIEVITHTKF